MDNISTRFLIGIVFALIFGVIASAVDGQSASWLVGALALTAVMGSSTHPYVKLVRDADAMSPGPMRSFLERGRNEVFKNSAQEDANAVVWLGGLLAACAVLIPQFVS